MPACLPTCLPAARHHQQEGMRAAPTPLLLSRQVAVQLAVLRITLKELPLNQALDALLDDRGVGQEAAGQLSRDLRYDGVVVQDLRARAYVLRCMVVMPGH